MNTKICIDKRIILLVLFTLPVIGLFLLTRAMNSVKLSTNSKASEAKNLDAIPTNVIPEGVRAVCLIPRKNTLENTIDLYLRQSGDLLSQVPIKVYLASSMKLQYIGLINSLPSDLSQVPAYSVNLDLLPAGEGVRFVGLQNGEEANLSSFSRSCSPIVAKSQ